MINLLTIHGELDSRIENDPRFSRAQKQSLQNAGIADRNAKLVGLDNRMRPVVEAKLGGAPRKSRYALLRSGEATLVTTPLAEEWHDRPAEKGGERRES